MNDSHGLIHVDGRYHLFFQHLPDSLAHATGCHWGHATSTDLLHWEHQPIALSPGDGDVGVWSGCAVVDDNGDAQVFYTSVGPPDVHRGSIRTARPDDPGLTAWVKGPVVVGPPVSEVAVFRDPSVFRDGPGWRMLVGEGDTAGVAGIGVYRSNDLAAWHPDGMLLSRLPTEEPFTGTAWECPQLVRRKFGLDADVLVVSVWSGDPLHVSATTGQYADGRFTPGAWQEIAVPGCHYAPTHFTDIDGRPCLLFWIRGIGDQEVWAGAISVPYVVGTEDGQIRLTPHPSLADARQDPVEGSSSISLDIEWSTDRDGSLVLVGPDGVDRAVLTLVGGVLTVRTSARDGEVVVDHRSAVLRVIVDAQVLEVVADGGLVGLPLIDVAGGFVPRADDPDRLSWWHLS